MMARSAAILNSGRMHQFEADFPVSTEQKRLLTYGAVLFTRNTESCRTLRLRADKSKVIAALASWWSIRNREDAISTVKDLSAANRHTLFADDVYKTLVLNGRLSPLRPEDLRNITGLENAYQSTIDRVSDSVVNPDKMTDEEKGIFQDRVRSELAARINAGIECYRTARDMLIYLGYSERELARIKSTAAWDFGRASVIARDSVKTRYMEENEAWEFMRTAADNAARLYSDWREYLAGYVFGRALGYGSNSKDIYAVLRFLLNNKNSPFREVSFSQ